MSFLDENDGTVTTDNSAEAEKLSKKGVNVNLVDKMVKEANAFLAAADAARDAGKKEFEFPKGSGKMHKVTLKRDLDLEEGKLSTALGGVAFLAGLLLMGKINSSDPVIQRLQAEYEQADPAQQDSIKNLMAKRILFLDTGKADASTPMNEKVSLKKALKKSVNRKSSSNVANKIGDALLGKKYDRPFSDLVDTIKDTLKQDDDTTQSEDNKLISKIAAIEKGNMSEKEFNSITKQLKKAGMTNKELKELEKRYKDARKDKNKKKPTNEGNCGCGQTPCKTYGKMKEDKQIKVDADQKFVIDLKHLMQKHGKEDTIKITKKLMKQLHDKGEVNIDGTKLMFKELDAPQDTQLALPEPPKQTSNFLGDDNMDYEGGMAKSQMLKMKNYAKALCDMIDDETQLEAWVQAKLTKASDYMSSVYHYLDYQQTKNLKENLSMMDTDEALVSILMGEANLSEETAEQVVDGLSGEDFKKAGLMMVRGVDERQIAKFVLSATTLDENINPRNIEWEDIEPDIENRLDYKEGTIFGYTSDGRQVQAHGSYSEFDGYQIIGDIELV